MTVAHTELRHAFHTMLDPLYIALSESIREFVKYSTPEFDLIPSGVDMLDTHIRVALAGTDLNAISPFEPITEYRPRWGKAIQDGLALSPPFAPWPVAMDFNDGAVDHGLLHVGVFGDGIEDASEDIAFDPVSEAFEDGVPVAEDFG